MEKSLPLETLMELAQAGDNNAYRHLLIHITKILRNFLNKRLFYKEIIEDVLQEILISIHKARHTYDSSRPFVPWVIAIAKFRLTDHLRKSYRAADNQMFYIEEISHEMENNVTNEDGEYEYLYKAIEELPQKQKNVVTLMKIEGLSVKEVAKECNMSESAVKTTAHRAYKMLKLIIEK